MKNDEKEVLLEIWLNLYLGKNQFTKTWGK